MTFFSSSAAAIASALNWRKEHVLTSHTNEVWRPFIQLEGFAFARPHGEAIQPLVSTDVRLVAMVPLTSFSHPEATMETN